MTPELEEALSVCEARPPVHWCANDGGKSLDLSTGPVDNPPPWAIPSKSNTRSSGCIAGSDVRQS